MVHRARRTIRRSPQGCVFQSKGLPGIGRKSAQGGKSVSCFFPLAGTAGDLAFGGGATNYAPGGSARWSRAICLGRRSWSRVWLDGRVARLQRSLRPCPGITGLIHLSIPCGLAAAGSRIPRKRSKFEKFSRFFIGVFRRSASYAPPGGRFLWKAVHEPKKSEL